MPDSRLLMICPSRGRPQNVAALWDAWRATTGPEASLLVAVDEDDPELDTYRALGVPLHVGPRLRLGGTLNAVSSKLGESHDAIGFLGDDHRPTGAWTVELLAELDRLGTGMAYGDDGIQGVLLPTAIAMTSDIIKELGYMVPPGLQHLYVDNAWLELGRAAECISYLSYVKIQHCHPIAGLAEWDAGYRECNSGQQDAHDAEVFARWKAAELSAAAARIRRLCSVSGPK